MASSRSAPRSISRRQQIIDVAAELFADRGYHGVSIYDLGSAMGTSGAALYKHFASKEALLGEMLVSISERLLAEAERRSDEVAGDGPEAILDVLIAWHVEFALTHPALITVQLRDLASLSETDRSSVRRLQRQYVERWAGTIRLVFGTDQASARSCAHAVFGLINSTPHSVRLRRHEMAELLQRMAIGALRAST
jgi:AcrR family transcriptional regulator